MPVGLIALLVVAILVYFGLLHRVLDRMRLDDRTALFILFLMIVGSFFSLTLVREPLLSVNIGGAVVPLGVGVYLVATADTRREQVRGTAAAVIAGAAIYAAIKVLNPEEQTMLIEPTYFFGLIAGVVGYLVGRSRRSAFIGGTVGVVLADLAHYVEISVRGVRGATALGGAGVLDAVVIAGLLAVALAEIVGETREYLARGPARTPAGDRGRAGRGGGPGGGRGAAALGLADRDRRERSGPEGTGLEPPVSEPAAARAPGTAGELAPPPPGDPEGAPRALRSSGSPRRTGMTGRAGTRTAQGEGSREDRKGGDGHA
ncbi:MAG: DUF1614 domain-containing protein [Bacillota bacterium]